jgi:hypothetical protein
MKTIEQSKMISKVEMDLDELIAFCNSPNSSERLIDSVVVEFAISPEMCATLRANYFCGSDGLIRPRNQSTALSALE